MPGFGRLPSTPDYGRQVALKCEKRVTGGEVPLRLMGFDMAHGSTDAALGRQFFLSLAFRTAKLESQIAQGSALGLQTRAAGAAKGGESCTAPK